MIQTKLVSLHPDDYSYEEQMVNDYACFGWTLAQRSVTRETEDGRTRDIEHNLTFQRDANIPNKGTLDALFLRYTVKKNEIQKAADAVAKPIRKYVPWFLIATAIFCAILFPTVYPAFLDLMWNPDMGMKIFLACLVLLFAVCGTMLFVIIPMAVANGTKQRNAAGNVRGRVYAEMSAIAREAAKYLQ